MVSPHQSPRCQEFLIVWKLNKGHQKCILVAGHAPSIIPSFRICYVGKIGMHLKENLVVSEKRAFIELNQVKHLVLVTHNYLFLVDKIDRLHLIPGLDDFGSCIKQLTIEGR